MQIENINNRLAEMISTVLETEMDQQFHQQLNDFTNAGISSIDFIRIVVMIENEYDFEFMDEDLVQTKFRSISDLSEYIQKRKVES